jgi:hypothetical protein
METTLARQPLLCAGEALNYPLESGAAPVNRPGAAISLGGKQLNSIIPATSRRFVVLRKAPKIKRLSVIGHSNGNSGLSFRPIRPTLRPFLPFIRPGRSMVLS